MEIIRLSNGDVNFAGCENYNKKIKEVINECKFISNGEDFISIVTNNNNLYYLIQDTDNTQNYLFVPIVDVQFGKIIYLKSFCNSTIIVNDKLNIYEIDGDETEFFVKEITLQYDLQKKEPIKFARGNSHYRFFTMKNNNTLYEINRFKGRQPITRQFSTEIKDLQCGNQHTVLLLNNGNVCGKGINIYGQLGEKKLNNSKIILFEKHELFTPISLPFKVKKINCYGEGTILLNEFDELFGSGRNEFGELGLGHNKNVLCFTKIVIDDLFFGKTIDKIYGTFYNNIIVTRDKEIFVTGKESFYFFEFGIEKKNMRKKFEQFYDIYYLDKFTKLNFKSNRKFIRPLLLKRDLLIVMTDNYLQYCEEETDKNGIFHNNCYLKLQNSQLCDIVMIVKLAV
ncbi:hypothetical protein ABK040_005528 [Willaertia magna]